MTTLGGLAIIMCSFVIPPIVMLYHSKVSSDRIWIFAVPIITIGTYLGIFLGPIIFIWLSPLGSPAWPSSGQHGVMLISSVGFAFLASAALYLAKCKKEEEEILRKQKIQDAIKRITADGIVEGPKGPYVRHKSWDIGDAPRTPYETKEKSGRGPYGVPRT